MTDPRDDTRFIERVAGVLREPEVLDEEFEQRVMALVREDARPWWRRSRTLTLSPLGGLALAAGFAGIVTLGALGAARTLAMPERAVSSADAGAPTAADTVHLVRFVIAAPGASQVALVGDFNGWTRGATVLAPVGDGDLWSVSVPLAPGRHEYAFVVDGERWMVDPLAARHTDDFGTESSVLRVGRGVTPGV